MGREGISQSYRVGPKDLWPLAGRIGSQLLGRRENGRNHSVLQCGGQASCMKGRGGKVVGHR